MSETIDGQIVTAEQAKSNYVPIVARVPITIRPAVMGDLAFIDRMQKKHSKELGFLPMAALEGKVRLGQVLIAEVGSGWLVVGSEEKGIPSSTTNHPLPTTNSPTPIGYLIAADRYQKRDEIGYVTQMCVIPEYRRSLVAAQLLQAQFDRSAYGCRLYCCWCAQDLKANEFWEAMGFTAIAFRTGSMTKGRSSCGKKKTPRVHIFWQKKIRANDAPSSTAAQWWYPSQTGGGELREDRLVFPIMPGVHWREVGPIVLDRGVLEPMKDAAPDGCHGLVLEAVSAVEEARPGVPDRGTRNAETTAPPKPKKVKRVKVEAVPIIAKPAVCPRARGGFWAMEEGVVDTLKTQKQLELDAKAEREASREAELLAAELAAKKPKKAARPAAADAAAKKIDPRLTAMSRELRDQWTERAEGIVEQGVGKHDVKRIAQASKVAAALANDAVEPMRLEQAA